MPRTAGFGRRLAAFGLDLLMLLIISGLLLYLVYGPAYFDWRYDPLRQSHFYGLFEVLVNNLLPLAATVMFWHWMAATPGKLLMGCRVVDARTGRPPTWGRALLRYVGYLLSALPLGLGFWWILWDRRRQGLHDKLAGTLVVLEDEVHRPLDELIRQWGHDPDKELP